MPNSVSRSNDELFNEDKQEDTQPTFGFLMIGGAFVGSVIHDLRLANELANRGFSVHIYWVMERTYIMDLHPSIKHHWLFSAGRYNGIVRNLIGKRGARFDDRIGYVFSALVPLNVRLKLYQTKLGRFDIVAWAMHGLIRQVCAGVESDTHLLRRFAATIQKEGITHLFPNISVFAPFCHAVKQYVSTPLSYLLKFQGYEVYGQYAEELGLTKQFHAALKRAARNSDYPSVCLSDDSAQLVQYDIGLASDEIQTVSACIELPQQMDHDKAISTVQSAFPEYNREIPLITYIGRQDAEKGIDLLLYAAKMLQQRGLDFQLAVCGTTSWGQDYRNACRRIAHNLRIPLLRGDFLSEELKTALYRVSHCIVYPSIHREPFGMVPVEAMAEGTPIVVPDIGGVSKLPHLGSRRAGLNFRAWDSRDLSDKLASLLEDDQLHAELQSNARDIAETYSVQNVCNDLLSLMALPRVPKSDAGEVNAAEASEDAPVADESNVAKSLLASS